jgi:hypothetical protein
MYVVYIQYIYLWYKSRDGAVGTKTGYGLDGREVGVLVPVGMSSEIRTGLPSVHKISSLRLVGFSEELVSQNQNFVNVRNTRPHLAIIIIIVVVVVVFL